MIKTETVYRWCCIECGMKLEIKEGFWDIEVRKPFCDEFCYSMYITEMKFMNTDPRAEIAKTWGNSNGYIQ